MSSRELFGVLAGGLSTKSCLDEKLVENFRFTTFRRPDMEVGGPEGRGRQGIIVILCRKFKPKKDTDFLKFVNDRVNVNFWTHNNAEENKLFFVKKKK